MRREHREETLLGFVENRRQAIVDFACQLVATPSGNPPGDERAVTEVILSRMRELGLDGAEVVARAPERPNLVYRQRGRTGTPSLILNGHTDTKPVGDEDRKAWRTDPWTPTIVDGKLYGLGSADMKGAIAAIVYAAAALRALDRAPEGDLMLVFTADEEAPGEFGANWLVKSHGIQADFCLVADTAGMETDFDVLHVVARNSVIFQVKVYGTQMHSSISDRFPSVNASVKMGWVLWRMARDLKLHFEPHPLYPKGPTINLGDVVSGGHSYGTLSGYAEFGSDIRIIPGMTREGVLRDIEAFLARLGQEDPDLQVELATEVQGQRPEWKWLQGDEPFVGILQSASERVLGRRPPLGGFPAFTDGFWFHSYAGIPTIPAFGPGVLSLAHKPNEYVSTEAVVQASKIYALAALRYLDGSAD
jgi:acetylornithine deacetylase/succinyl-diaminopimelate desuccinylase-like protein